MKNKNKKNKKKKNKKKKQSADFMNYTGRFKC